MDAIDPVFQSLLSYDRAHLRPPKSGMSIEAFRQTINGPLEAVEGPTVFDTEDFTIVEGELEIPARLYRAIPLAPKVGPVVLFVHGGGFVAGSLDSHDSMCRDLCRASGISVLAIAYRLAPEHRFPAAIEDCVAAIDWVGKRGQAIGLDSGRLAICGDSAGGYIALMATIATRDRDMATRPRHVGLLYPVVDPQCNTPSMNRFADGYILTREVMQWFWAAFIGKSRGVRPVVSLLDQDLAGLPPVSILTAEFDPLCDEGAALMSSLSRAGVDATVTCFKGMIHGFASLPHVTPVAAEALATLAAQTREALLQL